MGDDYISELCTKVKSLQTKFMKLHIAPQSHLAMECLNEMRVCHANAINYNNTLIMSLTQQWTSVPDAKKIQLSMLNSAVDVIHNCIKKCERKMFNESDLTELNTDTPLVEKVDKPKKIHAIVNSNNQVSVKGLTTDSNVVAQSFSEPFYSELKKRMSTPNMTETMNTEGLCNAMDILANNTTEAEKVLREAESAQKGGNHKNYVVNIWNSNCSHSLDFLKSWSEFIGVMRQSGSSTECHSLCCTSEPEDKLKTILEKANVTHFPTVLFFCGGNVHKHVGKTSSSNLLTTHNNLID